MLYTSINNSKIKDLKKLNSKKFRDLNNAFLVETKHLVTEAYNSGYLDEILVLEGSDFSLNVKTNYISKDVLKYLSNMPSPSEVIGICHKKEEKNFDGNVLILDDIQDPGNLGTIIRSAVAFNIDTVILSNGCADIYSDKVIRASEGMLFKINVIRNYLPDIIEKLKKEEYKIYGTKVDGGKELKTISSNHKCAIIMGNEGNGVSSEILEMCDDYIYININEKCESLNVAIATSIILYELGG
jgi:TrmH family RNA methyltransferase